MYINNFNWNNETTPVPCTANHPKKIHFSIINFHKHDDTLKLPHISFFVCIFFCFSLKHSGSSLYLVIHPKQTSEILPHMQNLFCSRYYPAIKVISAATGNFDDLNLFKK